MRLVLLTGSGQAHAYVANRLAAAHSIATTFVVEDRLSPVAAVRRALRRYSWRQMSSKALARVAALALRESRTRREEIRGVLGPDCEELRGTNVVRVVGLNSDEAYARIAAVRPDALLVYGTGIVGRRLLTLPAQIALNMHTGISPYYRGHACAFWPLFNGDLDRLGATVHECTADVDGGRIFRTGRARLQADDGVFGAFARCVEVGTELYVDTVRDLVAGTLHGQAQDLTLGREYRAAEKGWYEERRVRREVRRGLIRRHVEGGRRAEGQ